MSKSHDDVLKSNVTLIPATATSDDGVVVVRFDALPWFEQATSKEIEDLYKCDWGGNYAADVVATDLPGENAELLALFKRCKTLLGANVELCGFEVHVSAVEAVD